jgi:cation diffusion facilitator family transporter
MGDTGNKLEFWSPRRTAFLSVLSNTTLVTSKIVVGLITGSVAILSEGIHSGLDLLAALIAFFSISMAAQPPDGKHPYGHGKIENISGSVEALLIVFAGGYIASESIHKLHSGSHVENIDLGLLVMAFSAVVNIFVSRILFKVAKAHESPALEADAHHLSTDVYTSLGVVFGLFLVRITHLQWLDALVALAVAVQITLIGVKVLRASLADLIDVSLPDEEQEIIREVIERHCGQFNSYHGLKSRKAGNTRYLEFHLVINPDLNVKQAHDFCNHLESELHGELRNSKITIHVEPHKT